MIVQKSVMQLLAAMSPSDQALTRELTDAARAGRFDHVQLASLQARNPHVVLTYMIERPTLVMRDARFAKPRHTTPNKNGATYHV